MKAVIAEDEELLRRELVALVGKDFEIVAECEDGGAARIANMRCGPGSTNPGGPAGRNAFVHPLYARRSPPDSPEAFGPMGGPPEMPQLALLCPR